MEQEMLSELVKGLRDIFGKALIEIILYGSVARHEESSESDIDVAIVINGSLTAEERERFIDLESELDLRYEMVLSIIDIEYDKLEKWGHVLPFYKNIQEEGIVLWKASSVRYCGLSL